MAASFPLNLSGFKKIHQDKNTTTLKHEKHGHEIKLAHNALRPEHRAKLASLPMDKAHGDGAKNNPKLAESKKTPQMADGGFVAVKKENYKKFAAGGEVRKAYEEGTEDTPVSKDDSAPEVKERPTEEVSSFQQQQPQMPPMVFNIGTPAPQPQADPFRLEAAEAQDLQNRQLANKFAEEQEPVSGEIAGIGPPLGALAEGVGATGNALKEGATTLANTAPNLTGAPQNLTPDASKVSPSLPDQTLPKLPDTPTTLQKPEDAYAKYPGSDLPSIYKKQMEAFGQQQRDFNDAERVNKMASNQLMIDTAKRQEEFKTTLNDYHQEINHAIQDINNQHIDPNKWWNDKSTGSKIATAIGLFVGGLTNFNGKNSPLDFIHQTIKDDLEGQKLESSKRMNVFNAYNSKFKNDALSHELSLALANSLAAAQFQRAAFMTQNADNKARAALGQSDFQMKANQNILRATAINQLTSGQGLDALSEDMLPDDIKQRVVKLPDGKSALARSGKSAADTQAALTEYQKLKQLITRAREFQKNIGTTFPWSDKDAVADALHEEMVTSMGHLQALNRFTHEEGQRFSKMVPNVGAFRQGKVSELIDNLERSIGDKENAEKVSNLEGYRPLNFTAFGKTR